MYDKQIIITKWLENELSGNGCKEYLEKYEYKRVAIYGAGDIGRLLIVALRNCDMDPVCVIDRRANDIYDFEGLAVYTLQDFFNSDNEVDAIIVTILSSYDEIVKEVAKKRIDLPVMFFRDMIYEF